MANYCINILTVKGPKLDVDTFRKRAVGHSPWPGEETEEEKEKPNELNFHSLVPIPDNILVPGDKNAGHDWELKNWGCTGGALRTTIPAFGELEAGSTYVAYWFDTRWNPPIEFCVAVAKQWPTLTVILESEEGSSGFTGIAKFKADTKEQIYITW